MADERCRLETECTGPRFRGHVLTCVDHGDWTFWELDPAGANCGFEYEECFNQRSSSALMLRCVDETWRLSEYDGNLNPPAPCPLEMPDDGSPCFAGDDFGASAQACGYPCENGSWSVTGCLGPAGSEDDPSLGTWQERWTLPRTRWLGRWVPSGLE